MQREDEETQETLAASPSFEKAGDSDAESASSEEPKHSEDGTEDFEFAFLCDDPEIATADEIFFNGQIRTVYPLFDKDLFRLYQAGGGDDMAGGEIPAARVMHAKRVEDNRKVITMPLRKLMMEEEKDSDPTPSACSSSEESDELCRVPAESYCLWTLGGSVPPSPEMRKKSKSTGSLSLRWKLRDLVIGRSHSDGKQKFIFLASTCAPAPPPESEKKRPVGGDKARRKEKAPQIDVAAAHRLYYAKRDAAGTGDRRRPYLPYRKDLVGLFAGINGPSRGGSHPL